MFFQFLIFKSLPSHSKLAISLHLGLWDSLLLQTLIQTHILTKSL